jgi:undecaprenyl pyrophosphate synthase
MKEVLYYLYERRLLRQMRTGPMPTHIGIILDGNRRYGRRHGLTDPHAIYSLGARKLDEVTRLVWPTRHSRSHTLGFLHREFRAADGTGFRHPGRHRSKNAIACQ